MTIFDQNERFQRNPQKTSIFNLSTQFIVVMIPFVVSLGVKFEKYFLI